MAQSTDVHPPELTMRPSRSALPVVLLLAAACSSGRPDPARAADSSNTPMSSAGMKMEAMPMLAPMRSHLDSITGPGMMQTEMAAHGGRVRALVSAMQADLMKLGLHSDAAYEALSDSVIADLGTLDSAPAGEREALATQHRERVRRLMAVYETMAAKQP
jgi:hypothetical protein